MLLSSSTTQLAGKFLDMCKSDENVVRHNINESIDQLTEYRGTG